LAEGEDHDGDEIDEREGAEEIGKPDSEERRAGSEEGREKNVERHILLPARGKLCRQIAWTTPFGRGYGDPIQAQTGAEEKRSHNDQANADEDCPPVFGVNQASRTRLGMNWDVRMQSILVAHGAFFLYVPTEFGESSTVSRKSHRPNQ
jgi:hypothetical protein